MSVGPMRTLLLLVPLAVGCHYATAPDPCPTPVEAHPEAWKAVPMTDAAGNVIAYSYVCVSSGLVASVAKQADSATIHIVFRRP